MTYNKRYEFPELVRKNIEQSDFPIAIYQMIDGKLKTILVTEGLIKMQGMDRDSLIAYLVDLVDSFLSLFLSFLLDFFLNLKTISSINVLSSLFIALLKTIDGSILLLAS